MINEAMATRLKRYEAKMRYQTPHKQRAVLTLICMSTTHSINKAPYFKPVLALSRSLTTMPTINDQSDFRGYIVSDMTMPLD